MSKLIEIFQIARDYNQETLWDTTVFFSKPLPRKKAYADVLKHISSVEHWADNVFADKGTVSLSDGDHSVDFNYLIHTLDSGEVKGLYNQVRVIRSEIMMAATKEEFEEMKRLQEFWEAMECGLMGLFL